MLLEMLLGLTLPACGVCSNDAFDADMNVDGNKPESVVNLTGNRNAVMIAAWSCFAVGVASLWRLTTGWVRDFSFRCKQLACQSDTGPCLACLFSHCQESWPRCQFTLQSLLKEVCSTAPSLCQWIFAVKLVATC